MNYQKNSSKEFEKDLLSFFSSIVYVNENPSFFEVEYIYKINDETIHDIESTQIDLEDLIVKEDCMSLMLSEDNSLVDDILCKSNKEDVCLSMWKRICGKEFKAINKKVKKDIKKLDYIITNQEISDILNVDNEIFINDSIEDNIIIGNKSDIIMHKYFEVIENNYIKIMHSIDYSAFKVYNLIRL
jgi:hypothetical protein